MLLTTAQLDEFKAEGAVPVPGLVPPDALEGWQGEFRRACSHDGVDLDDPATWPAGRYAPQGGWPELNPCLYDLPGLQSIVEQLGGGAFAPSHPAGAAVVAAGADDAGDPAECPGHGVGPACRRPPRWVRHGLGRRVHGVLRGAAVGREQPPGAAAPRTGRGRTWRTTATSWSTRSASTARTCSRSRCAAADTGRSWMGTRVWARSSA